MKRFATIYILIVLCGWMQAAERHSERVFLSTDRAVYVSGERVLCSAFCLDAATGKMSDFSSIAYVELHNAQGLAQTGKIALRNGRGGGSITLGSNLPSGNYTIVAYTALALNEQEADLTCGSRTISVINTSSSQKVKDGVSVVEDSLYPDQTTPSGYGQIDIHTGAANGGTVPLRISNFGKSAAAMSISVWHDDGIVLPSDGGAAGFKSRLASGSGWKNVRTPEFEGEIIRGRVVGLDPARTKMLEGKYAFLSSPGDKSDTYSSPISSDGSVCFYTDNIYSDRDIVCEIENLDSDASCHIELDSPFADIKTAEAPKLVLCEALKDRIERRAAAARIEKMFDADTLYEFLPVREHPQFGSDNIKYNLDDYTRFPTMEEVIREIIPEMRARKGDDGHWELQVRHKKALILLDGTPVFDHDKIYAYDPLLVESVTIYPYSYSIGSRTFEGVVNFITYKKSLPSMNFSSNVRISSFHGASYPTASTGAGISEDYPDYRQTIYWHPMVEIQAGQAEEISLKLPVYGGKFRVVVEGFTAEGEPFCRSFSFLEEH